MRLSQLLSLACLFVSIGLLSSCQEEEAAGLTVGRDGAVNVLPTNPIINLPPTQAGEKFMAESILFSDRHTTEILGQEGAMRFRIRPKGCPRIGRLCDPGFEFLLIDVKGVDPRRFIPEKGANGLIVDPKTESVVATLAEVTLDPKNESITLFYAQHPEAKVVSSQLQVTFSTLYETGKSVEKVSFAGEVTSEIIEYLP